MENYAEILFRDQKIAADKDTLTYTIPKGLKVKPGYLVEVPLRNKHIPGLIWQIHNEKPSFKTKPISEPLTGVPLLNESQIKLINWMSKYYFCPRHKILKLFISEKIWKNKEIKEKPEDEQINRSQNKQLTKNQEAAIKRIKTDTSNTFLIHGITGSGKTEIYAQLAKSYTKNHQQVLILVPEISLTPQTIEYFESTLGQKVAAIHSKLNLSEKARAWKKIHSNEIKLVIGSRSALFSPFQKLGLAIVDEEHEFTYKQDQAPRYRVHEVLAQMQKNSPELKVVYGSATPSVETKEKLKDSTITISERIGDSTLPEIEIVDLRDEFKKGNYSIFSEKLAKEIQIALSNKEQVILFLNRRGSASSMLCRDCGTSVECPKCEIKMTYHARTISKPCLICHHCGRIDDPPETCPNCQGPNIRFLGIGTQRIEKALSEEFPQARVLRADKDTTSKKHAFKEIYQQFKKHEADILIGTQMIAKGLHLPKVNLVGVIIADIGLSIPDFRISERNFQLMTQVAGRAGRSTTKGKVIIQTYNPDHLSLICTKNHDYQSLFNYERTQRQLLKNPPFSKLAKIMIKDQSLQKCQEKSESLERQIWQIARELDIAKELEINTYPAFITRLKGQYHYVILIKAPAETSTIHKILEKLPKKAIMSPEIKVDIDPISTI